MTVTECIRKIYKTSGIMGFYKGITASYVGISETVIHFVIYEALKSKIVSPSHQSRYLSCHLSNVTNCFDFLTICRQKLGERTLARVEHLVTSQNSCWLVRFRRLWLPAWHIRMRWRGHVYARRVTNIALSGKPYSRCGKRRAKPGSTGMHLFENFNFACFVWLVDII